MSDIMRFQSAARHDREVAIWFNQDHDPLRILAARWFEAMRACGEDVCELMHDSCPTACLGEAAFAYVGAFKAHVSVGFFQGASLPDPAGLLEGAGRRMRHVKLRWGQPTDETALEQLILAAYRDMAERLIQDP